MRIVPHLLIGLLGIASATAFDSVVIINEIHYNPAAGQQEFVELRNLNGVDINLGRWRLSGGADYTFPEGTIIPGHGYLVLGNVPGALAPFTGALSNSSETIRLRNQNDRIMDEVTYDDGGDWPLGADGSGFTLARRTSDANPDPSSWSVSQQPGGTPGSLNFLTGTAVDRTLIANDAAWKYYDADTAPPADWAAANFTDTAWTSGTANFGTGGSSTPSLSVTTNLVERFRASAITGVADGGVVATWTDTATDDGATQSGIAGTTTPTLRLNTTPTGKATVRFDGNDQLRTSILPGIAPTSGFCYWIVLKANAAQTSGFTTDGSGNYIFDRALTGGGAPLVSLKSVGGAFGLQKRYDNNTGLGGPVTTSLISQSAYQIVTVRRNTAASRWEMWVNGVMESTEADSGAALTPDPINIGRYSSGTAQGFIGDIAEILIYKDSLSAGDFQSVGTYLEAEYGLDTAFPGSAITTPLSATAPTAYFRKSFNYPGVVSQTSLRLENIGADGSVFYLNGTEIQRTNLPAGAISHTTPANADVPAPASTGFLTVPASALVNGTNVLAVSLHRAAGSTDSLFDASLAATESPEDPALAQNLVFNEIPGAPDFPFFVEIKNASAAAVDTTGWSIRSSAGPIAALPATTLAPGALFVVDSAALGFTPMDGDKFFLLNPGAARLTDAREVTSRRRGLDSAGVWAHPAATTPGTANTFSVNGDIVINEIYYHALNDGPEQWIELYNKSAVTVDLGGWKFADAVSWLFPTGTTIAPGGYLVVAWDPAAFSALHPGKTAIGPWSGSLSGKGETITLRDIEDNITDQVRYADGGRWSQWADGGGGSLELKDPRADNSNPQAWDSSDETLSTPWQNYTITGTGAHATTSSLTYFNEFIMGLLDSGEILIDDISIKEVNVGNREIIQNGTFSAGTAATWRNIGTHSKTEVVTDPFNPAEKVLKIVATGGTEHMNNHCETTLKAGATYVNLSATNTYTITFRAKWLRGSNRLSTRLFFNRLARQTQLPLPATGGTPGAANSRLVPNLGPTLNTLTATPVLPVVPAAGVPAAVTIAAQDPDGIATVELLTSLNGAAFVSTPMTVSGAAYTASIPGQAAAAKVQFYIKATDTAGAFSYWPAAGPDSRAMIPWQDGNSQFTTTAGAKPHNIRVVMTGADANFLYRAENVQSNDYRPCTFIYDDNRAWYEAGTRLKSSEHGRFQQNRVGFNVKFGTDDMFLGAHETISIDRSGNKTTEGLDGTSVTSQREILVKAVTNAAGGIYSVEDDLIRVIPPISTGTPAPLFTGSGALGEAILSKSRFDDEYLDGQWDQGGKGPVFKQEYIYPLTETINPTTRAVTTIGASGNLNATAEQPKVPQTGGSPGPSGIAVQAYNPPAGVDPKENYRWHWLIRNAKGNDDYTGLIAAITAVGQVQNSVAFKTQTAAAIDVDTWMRAIIPAQLFGVTDNYLASTGSTHNFLLYFPPGQKGVAIPWDLDFLGQSATNGSIIAGGDITKFIANPVNKRRYYGMVLDVLNKSFNDAFLTRWATHYSTFGVDDMTTSLTFLRARATYVRNLLNGVGQAAPVPVVAFTRTSAATMTSTTPFATITGDGWIDIETIRLAGNPVPLNVTWTDDNSWTLQLPLFAGTHTYTLEGVRPNGTVSGTVTVTVTSTSGIAPAASDNLVVSKVHYHPANPSLAESNAGYTSADDFEYIELQNISANIVDLTDCRFDTGITYTFAANTRIPAGDRLVIPRRTAAFALRYPGVATAPQYMPAADPTANKLSDSGEELSILSAAGLDVKRFTYDDNAPWPTAADGSGSALVLVSPLVNPEHGSPWSWRADGAATGSTPGAATGTAFTGSANADTNANGRDDLVDFAVGSGSLPSISMTGLPAAPTFLFTMERDASAQVTPTLEISTDLTNAGLGAWVAPTGVILTERTPLTGSMERLVFTVPAPAGAARAFIRARFTAP